MKRLLTPLVLVLLACLPLTSCQSGMIAATNVEGMLRPVLARHDAMIQGTLNPATMSAVDKRSFRRSSYILTNILNVALGQPEVPLPPDLVETPTEPVPPKPAQ